jgi:hypothetical protein
MNISYQDEFTRLIRQETEQTNLASQAKLKLAAANRQLSISARAASVAAWQEAPWLLLVVRLARRRWLALHYCISINRQKKPGNRPLI